jgi:hypothetical protein
MHQMIDGMHGLFIQIHRTDQQLFAIKQHPQVSWQRGIFLTLKTPLFYESNIADQKPLASCLTKLLTKHLEISEVR